MPASVGALPRLHAIHILPGTGNPIPLEEVGMALELLLARGLFIQTHCETEEQARALLKAAEKRSHD